MCKFSVVILSLVMTGLALPQTPTTVEPDPGKPEEKTTSAADSNVVAEAKPPLFDFRLKSADSMAALLIDSTSIVGSRYTSFGDVLDLFPGGYFANLGSPGQPAFASLFGTPAGEMELVYDELLLNDLLTNQADLNLLPVESLGSAQILHSSDKPYDFTPLGSTLSFRSKSLTGNPIRTQVGYRTGFYTYDDVDARLGAQSSSRFWLDAGGVIRRYTGYIRNAAYGGHQIDLKLNRRLGSDWLLRYLLLSNDRDLQLPIPAPFNDFDTMSLPQQMDKRTDHALVLRRRDQLLINFQATLLENDLRDQNRSIYAEEKDASALRYAAQWSPSLWNHFFKVGVMGRHTRIKSDSWGNHRDWSTSINTSCSGQLAAKLKGYARLSLQKKDAFSPQILPELNLVWHADSSRTMSFWLNRTIVYPSLQSRYAAGVPAWGNPLLDFADYYHGGVIYAAQRRNIAISTSLAMQRRLQQILPAYEDERVIFINQSAYSILVAEAQADFQWNKIRLFTKGQLFQVLTPDLFVVNRPHVYLQGFLQYHLLAFKNDLNARLRLGCSVLGRSKGAVPFHAAVSNQLVDIKPAVYPYVHAILDYGDADIFFAYDNFIDAQVSYVYGYVMPQLWFHWGFVWHFVD